MLKYEKKQIQKEIEIFNEIEVRCDKCDKTKIYHLNKNIEVKDYIKYNTHQDIEYEIEKDFINFKITFGYESDFDNEVWNIFICKECFYKFIADFKNIPDGMFQENMNFSELTNEDKLLLFKKFQNNNK